MKAPHPLPLALVVASLAPALAIAQQASARSEHVTARLVSEVTAIRAGEPFTVALQLTMAPSWHTYWKNPGDSGMPTRVVWTLPDGFKAGDLQWPTPVRAVDAGLALYGYEGEATFLAEVTPTPGLPPGQFTVGASVSWLECRDICIPGKARLALSLPVSTADAAAPLDPRARDLFAEARKAMPGTLDRIKASHGIKNDRLVLTVSGASSLAAPLEFFPETTGLIEAAEAQKASKAGSAWVLSMKRAANAPEPPAVLDGVLVTGSGPVRRSYRISASGASGRGASPK